MLARLAAPAVRLSAALAVTACAPASTSSPGSSPTETPEAEPGPAASSEAPDAPVELEATTAAKITIELVNECSVAKRFVLASPEYPDVEPPADAKIHELAAGERKRVLVEAGQWFLHLNDDDSVGGGGSSREDGARITFREPNGTCSSVEVIDRPD